MTAEPKDAALGAIVIFPDRAPDIDHLRRALQNAPDLSSLTNLETAGETLLAAGDGVLMSFMRFDLPSPLAPDDPSVMHCWSWPGAEAAVAGHQAHILVSISSDRDSKSRVAMLAKATAAVLDAAPAAAGVLWAASASLWPREMFRHIVADADGDLPVPLCAGVRIAKEADGQTLSAATVGLAGFGLMDIEARGFYGQPLDLLEQIAGLAGYLLASGPVIKDGDTIGEDALTRIEVRHENSSLGSGGKVYRVYFGQSGSA